MTKDWSEADDRTIIEEHELAHQGWNIETEKSAKIEGDHHAIASEAIRRGYHHPWRDGLDDLYTQMIKAAPPSNPEEVVVKEKFLTLRVRDPGMVVARLRSGSSAGFLARNARNGRADVKQALMKRGGGSLVYAIVTIAAGEKFESLRDVPKSVLHGIEEEDLHRFGNAHFFWYHGIKAVKLFHNPVKLVRSPSAAHRRFGGRADLHGASESVSIPTPGPDTQAAEENEASS